MSDLSLSAVRRMLGDERGLALPLALGVTVVLSALAAGIFTYVTTNQGAAERARADQRAYGLADAGLSYATSTLKNAPDPTSGTAVPETTVALPGGTVTYRGVLSGGTWTLTGVGTVRNPSGPGAAPVVRTVSIQYLVGGVTVVPDMTVWEYLFIDAPLACTKLENGNIVAVSVYVRGDLCMQNNATIQNAPKVHVLGSVYITNSAQIGDAADPVGEFERGGNCYYEGTQTTCGPASRIWADSIGTSPPTVAKPGIDLLDMYANADLGPLDPCTSGSFPGGFDNNLILDVSLDKVNLTPASGYDCKKVVAGETVAQITWQPGSPGTLTVKGTIYVDGHLYWQGNSNVQYDGKAVIYATGMLTIENFSNICAVAACDGTWDPDQDLLMLVIGSQTDATTIDPKSIEIKNNTNFQGALYAVKDVFVSNYANVWGPVVSRSATISNFAVLHPTPGVIDWMYGVPAGETTLPGVTLVPGSYAG